MLAVIAGSGLEALGAMEAPREVAVSTPYGPPSPGLAVGRAGGREVVFLPRHGTDHHLPPHRIPYRANLWALHALGVTRIVALSAMGGLRPQYRVGDLAIPDQFIDWTRGRPATFFDGPQVVHTAMADPFCPELRTILAQAGEGTGARVHRGGVALTFEGPRFSTRAESRLFRDALGADLLSMTQVPEVVLARELGMCYGACAVITDLDVWGETEVRAEEVTRVMEEARPRLVELLSRVLDALPPHRGCACGRTGSTAPSRPQEEAC